MIHTVDGRNSANQLIWRISIFRVIGFRIITPGAGFLPSTVGRIATSASIGHLDVLYEDEMRICIESRAWVSHLSSSGEPEESRSRTSTSPLLILLARNIHLSGGFISTKKNHLGKIHILTCAFLRWVFSHHLGGRKKNMTSNTVITYNNQPEFYFCDIVFSGKLVWDWWFGFLVSLYERGTPIRIPNHRAPNHQFSITTLKTNISPPKIDGWKIKFPFNMVPFFGCHVNFWEGIHSGNLT